VLEALKIVRPNLMQSKIAYAPHRSPRYGARTRRGSPCQPPAMPNGRCRLHGGLSPGAPTGNRNALKHGRYIAEAVARRHEIGALLRTMWALSGMTEAES